MLNRRISDTIGNDYLDAVQRFLFGWAVVPGSGVTISPMSWSMLLSNPPSLPPLGITFLALGLRFVPGGVSRLGSRNTLSGLAHTPAKPACAFLARFGWAQTTQNLSLNEVTKVRRWLAECQTAMWSAKDH